MALWFARLATDRLQRREAAAPGAPPLVVAAREKNALRLAAVDAAAARLGLMPGQALANARAMVPELRVVPQDIAADDALLMRLAAWCDRFTPLVAVEAPQGLLLDVSGAAHLFGGEAALLGHILASLRATGFGVQGAIAGTARAARALARHKDGCIVPPGEERAAISCLPIEALALDAVVTHAFRRAGLKTLAQAAGRKRAEITARFGAGTLAALDEICGMEASPISPRPPQPDYWLAQNFAVPVITQEVIRASLLGLAQKLCAWLEQDGAGARQVAASFFRADGATRRIGIETAGPTREAQMLDRLFQERLAALADPLDPGFGFDLIRLHATRVERWREERAGLEEDARAEGDIRFLIDQLSARFGRGKLLRLEPQDTHVPEQAWRSTPAQEAQGLPATWPDLRAAGEAPCRPLRLLAPPELAEVMQEPLRLTWRRAVHRLRQWEGPERIALEWWRGADAGAARDYYRAEDDDGRRFWLFCEAAPEPARWFVHGLFA